MGAIVFASAGSRKYHFDQSCSAFQSAQLLSDWDCGCDTYCTHRLPRMHGLVRMSATKAAMDGKLPCLACVPAHLREMPDVEDFGHEPFEYDGVPICARCYTNVVRISVDAFENAHRHVVRWPVLWPCTSAIVLGLAPREEAA